MLAAERVQVRIADAILLDVEMTGRSSRFPNLRSPWLCVCARPLYREGSSH